MTMTNWKVCTMPNGDKSDRPLVWGIYAMTGLIMVLLVVGSKLGISGEVLAAFIAWAGGGLGAIFTYLQRRQAPANTAPAPTTPAPAETPAAASTATPIAYPEVR